MIVTRSKPIEEIMDQIDQIMDQKICVIGCSLCAGKLKTGGEPEVKNMIRQLQDKRVNVIDGVVLKHACSIESWESLIKEQPVISDAEVLLVMSCGIGVSLLGRLCDKIVIPALDTVSLGAALNDEILLEMCSMCGQCTVGFFSGLCPKSGCPKSQLNGPCGGSNDGECEVRERKCIWTRIYEVMEAKNILSMLNETLSPTEYNRGL